MAVLYRSNYMSRPFEEALMRAQAPYVIVGDVGFYQRAEIKDALVLLRLAACPDDYQSDEAFRRMVNVPARGLGPKAMEEIHDEVALRMVPLLQALETARLPPKARAHALGFIEAIRSVTRDRAATLADQVSMLVTRSATAACCARAVRRRPSTGWRTCRSC